MLRKLKTFAAVLAFGAAIGTAHAEEKPIGPDDRALVSCAMQAVAKAREAIRTGGNSVQTSAAYMAIYNRIEPRIYAVLTAKGWTRDEVSSLLDDWYLDVDYLNAAAAMADVCRGVDPALWQ